MKNYKEISISEIYKLKNVNVLTGNGFSRSYDDIVRAQSRSYEEVSKECVNTAKNKLTDKSSFVLKSYLNSLDDITNIEKILYDLDRYKKLDEHLSENFDNEEYDKIKAIMTEQFTKFYQNTYGNVNLKLNDNIKEHFTTNYIPELQYICYLNDDTQVVQYGIKPEGTLLTNFLAKDNNTEMDNECKRIRSYHVHGGYLIQGKKNSDSYEFMYINSMNKLGDKICSGYQPYLVLEGTSEAKLAKINKSDYLKICFEKFSRVKGSLLIVGHSLSSQDDHIVKAINNNKYITDIVIVIFAQCDNEYIRKKLEFLTKFNEETLNKIRFFHSCSSIDTLRTMFYKPGIEKLNKGYYE